MSEVTNLLNSLDREGELHQTRLLSLIYEELKKLARLNMAREKPGSTLQPTALVHEAYLRLVSDRNASEADRWKNRRHFYGAAARAMRRILVERARQRMALRYGGGRRRVEIRDEDLVTENSSADLMALDEALAEFEQQDRRASEVVHLRYFAGLDIEETARTLGIAPRTVKKDWTMAKAWLHQKLSRS
jgi:RNA polymerase sigma factor (TIGR02999 family)